MIAIRPATDADVAAMSEVLTASIRDLCTADHGNSPEILSRWTANKTEEGVRNMLANPDARALVAEVDGEVAAVGCLVGDSEVGLNYVHPRFRFRGVSRALLKHMEAALRAAGVGEAALTSTLTAHRFYLAAGWEDAGPPQDHSGMICQPMRKRL